MATRQQCSDSPLDMDRDLLGVSDYTCTLMSVPVGMGARAAARRHGIRQELSPADKNA